MVIGTQFGIEQYMIGSREIALYLSISTETARKLMNEEMFGKTFHMGVGKQRKHKRVLLSHFLAYCNQHGMDVAEQMFVQGRLLPRKKI